jgi:hypothetical protein
VAAALGAGSLRALALGLGLSGLAATLLRLRPPEMGFVLLRALLVGCARFAERDSNRLPRILDLPPTPSRAEFAMLELVHDAADGFLLRLGFLRHRNGLLLTPQRTFSSTREAGASKDNEVSVLRFLAVREGDHIPLAKRELGSKPHRSAYAGDCFAQRPAIRRRLGELVNSTLSCPLRSAL